MFLCDNSDLLFTHRNISKCELPIFARLKKGVLTVEMGSIMQNELLIEMGITSGIAKNE
jgi:hypothetical protein